MISSSNVSASANPLRKLIENTAIRQFKKSTYFMDAGEQRSLPSGSATYTFNVMGSSSAVLGDVTLSEGVTPSGRNLAFTQVVSAMTQYGDYVEITDVAAKDNPFPLIEESAWELGRRMAEIVDAVVQAKLVAGTQTIIRTAADATTTRGALVAADTIRSKRFAEANAIMKRNATPEIGSGYVAYLHPNVHYDLVTETTTGSFIDVMKYARPEEILNGEVGKFSNCRIVIAPNITVLTGAGAGGINVYPTYVVGKWAYGVVMSQQMETYYQDFGSSGTQDPLKQRATVGIKVRFGAEILKQEALVRIESSSSLG